MRGDLHIHDTHIVGTSHRACLRVGAHRELSDQGVLWSSLPGPRQQRRHLGFQIVNILFEFPDPFFRCPEINLERAGILGRWCRVDIGRVMLLAVRAGFSIRAKLTNQFFHLFLRAGSEIRTPDIAVARQRWQ